MSKMLEIEMCIFCQFQTHNHISEKTHCTRTGKELDYTTILDFPSWCPLPDKSENDRIAERVKNFAEKHDR